MLEYWGIVSKSVGLYKLRFTSFSDMIICSVNIIGKKQNQVSVCNSFDHLNMLGNL